MKKFLTSLFGILLIAGILAGIGSFSDAMVALSGKKVDLNTSSQADFTERAVVEGEVYYVYDCFAVEEVTRTTYGIKTGTDETNFYLIESYNKAWFDDMEADYEPLTLVYSTSDKDKIAKLDAMVEDWYAFEEALYNAESEEDIPEYPAETFELKGIITQSPDDKVAQYRNEYLEEIGYSGEDLTEYINQYCVDMIIDDRDPSSSKGIFFGAIAVAVIGLVGLIATFVGSRRAAKREELY